MNLQEYISSGILESYALGTCTAEERAEVESNLKLHPELRKELIRIEETLEVLAQRTAIKPNDNLKTAVMNSVTKKEAQIVPIQSQWKFAAAASMAIALVASWMAFSYHERWRATQQALDQLTAQNQQVAGNYNQVNERLEKLQTDLAIIENTAFTRVVMKGTTNDVTALASVYWNASTHEAYLSIQNLKAISKDNQFQLWAIVRGVPVDVGVFDKDFRGLLKMKNVEGAAAFAVTIEPRGGNTNPTLQTMQVIGALPRGG